MNILPLVGALEGIPSIPAEKSTLLHIAQQISQVSTESPRTQRRHELDDDMQLLEEQDKQSKLNG